MRLTLSTPTLPPTVHSAEDLFGLPALAYLRASQGERIALVCRGIGGLQPRVEALGGRLVWFFCPDERPVSALIEGESETFDLVVEFSHAGSTGGQPGDGAIINAQSG